MDRGCVTLSGQTSPGQWTGEAGDPVHDRPAAQMDRPMDRPMDRNGVTLSGRPPERSWPPAGRGGRPHLEGRKWKKQKRKGKERGKGGRKTRENPGPAMT